MNAALRHEIYQSLSNAFHHNELDSSITSEMLPSLTEALEPPLQQYITKYGSFPIPKNFQAIANNFVQDGILVQAFLNLNTANEIKLWQNLQKNLERKTQQSYPKLDPIDHDEIVAETLKRIQRYLPAFLFRSRLNTWITTIWRNECFRLLKKVKTRKENETSLGRYR